MAWRTRLEIVKLRSQGELYKEYRGEDVSIYAGSTEDPRGRVRNHEISGYSGTFYCAKTENMKMAEDRLLRGRKFKYNKYQKSTSQEEWGYVYIINGKRCREGKLEMREVALEHLHNFCHEDGSIYVGSTDHLEDRKEKHETSGFSGTFYYARVANKKVAEGRLLRESPYRYLYNEREESNSPVNPGYVYLICGWRNASRRGTLEVEEKTRNELHKLCQGVRSIYVGSMRTCQRGARINAYMESGFWGIFYYAQIHNMREAEDEILQIKPGGYRWNTQTQSNRKEERGCVFLINGERYE